MPSTSSTPNAIDRNALSAGRIRRNFQRLANGAATGTVKTAPPLTGGSTLGLKLATSTGLGVVANALALLFADATITGSSTGIKVGTIAESQVTNLTTDLAARLYASTALGTTAPLTGGGNLSTGLTLALPQATSTVNGYLLSTDWTTFNSKQSAGSYMAGSTTLNATTPLQGGGTISTGLTLSVARADAATNGYLTSTDWNTFNSKQPAGSYAVTTRLLNTTAPLTGGGDLSADRTLAIPAATSTANGYLSSTDWTNFNGKQAAGSYAPTTRLINTTAPLTGGGDLSADRTHSIARATASVDGYLAAADFASFAAPVNGIGFKNKVINGNFDVWQRNTTFTQSGAITPYSADRWQTYPGTGGTATYARAAFTAGQTAVPGEPAYYYDWNQTTGSPDGPLVQQPIEDVRTMAGQAVTITFYAQAVTTGFGLNVVLVQNFGSGGSGEVNTAVATATLIAGVWTKFTYTVTVPSITGKTIGAGSMLKLRFQMPVSTILHGYLASVQLEPGSLSTAFDKRPFGVELRMCERYYYKTYDYDTVPGAVNCDPGQYGNMSSGTAVDSVAMYVPFKVPMRIAPTVLVIYSYQGTAGKITANGGAQIAAFAASLGQNGCLISNNAVTTDQTKHFGHLTAEAEL